jgi:hypothetical protein
MAKDLEVVVWSLMLLLLLPEVFLRRGREQQGGGMTSSKMASGDNHLLGLLHRGEDHLLGLLHHGEGWMETWCSCKSQESSITPPTLIGIGSGHLSHFALREEWHPQGSGIVSNSQKMCLKMCHCIPSSMDHHPGLQVTKMILTTL